MTRSLAKPGACWARKKAGIVIEDVIDFSDTVVVVELNFSVVVIGSDKEECPELMNSFWKSYMIHACITLAGRTSKSLPRVYP